MTKPVIVGEAPSLVGDGRPFTGPSGERLQQLLGLTSYDELCDTFEMLNLFNIPQPVWDRFDRDYARKKALRLIAEWQSRPDPVTDVLLMGRKVMRAFGVEHLDWLSFSQAGNLVLWAFPHPSGLNHFWNDEGSERAASSFLQMRANAGRTDHPQASIPLNLDQPQAAAK